MSLTVQGVPLEANPRAVAERLADQGDLFFLWSADGSGASYVGIHPVECSHELDPEPGLPTSKGDPEVGRTPRWIGLLPYESQRHLERPAQRLRPDPRATPHVSQVSWWRFGAVVCIDSRVRVIGDDPAAVAQVTQLLQRPPLHSPPTSSIRCSVHPRPGEALDRHLARIVEAQRRIAAGDIYQVNLARRIEVDVTGEPLQLLDFLCRETRPPFAMALRSGDLLVLSTSPELFLRQSGAGEVETIPIKGTRPRSGDPLEDSRLAAELAADPKERAELSMIVDVERNDLGRVALPGSVSVPRSPEVVSTGLVWHRVARIVAQCAPTVSRRQLLEALLPSGSVTGAPKVRAMEIIAELESERRGLYTGAMGAIDVCGRLNLSIAIRTLTVRDGLGHYFSGGGIVADSVPKQEIQETEWKARQLRGLTL